ncbi:iron chelate uptake ABC transporter family permease subunit, partial [Streptomyces sp. Act-28]
MINTRTLYLFCSAAPPVFDVARVIEDAQARGWDVCLGLTPSAARWLEPSLDGLAALTGHPVRSAYKRPGDPDVWPPADARLLAPAPVNTGSAGARGPTGGLVVGGAAAFALTYGLSLRKGSVAPERLVLVGIGTFALTTAATNYLVVGARFQVAQALTWLSGSTYARDVTDLSVLAVAVVVGAALLVPSFRRLDLLALGEDTPRTLGLPLERTRLAVLVLAVALAACAVAV